MNLSEELRLIIPVVMIVAAIIGAVLYLRADARANRQEVRADIAALSASVAQVIERVTALETRVDGLETSLNAKRPV